MARGRTDILQSAGASQSSDLLYLTVNIYLRKFNGVTLVEELLNRGGESEKYILIAPGSGPS